MSGKTDTPRSICYQLPRGVDLQRWFGGDEFVVYHSGTGETLRLSKAAAVILDILAESGPVDVGTLAHALLDRLDEPTRPDDLRPTLEKLLSVLVRHDCAERVACS